MIGTLGFGLDYFADEFGGGRLGSDFGHKGSSLTFDDVASTEALFAAWDNFRRGKRSRLDVNTMSAIWSRTYLSCRSGY